MALGSTPFISIIENASGSSFSHTGFTFEGDPDVLYVGVANTGDSNFYGEYSSLTFDSSGANVTGTQIVQNQQTAQNAAWYSFTRPGGGWPSDAGGLDFDAVVDTEVRGAVLIAYEASDVDSVVTTMSDGAADNQTPSLSTSSVENDDIVFGLLCNRFDNDLTTSDTEDLDSGDEGTTPLNARVWALRETVTGAPTTLGGTLASTGNRWTFVGFVLRFEADPLSNPSVPTNVQCIAGEGFNTVTWDHDEVTSSFLVRYKALDTTAGVSLSRDSSGLVAQHIANDGTDPFDATDWTTSGGMTFAVNGSTGELEITSSANTNIWRRARYTPGGQFTDQGLVQADFEQPSGSGGDLKAIVAGVFMNTGNDIMGAEIRIGESPDVIRAHKSTGISSSGDSTSVTAKSDDTAYVVSAFGDDTGANADLIVYDFDSDTEETHTHAWTTEHWPGLGYHGDGTGGDIVIRCNRFYVQDDRYIVVDGLDTGDVVYLRNSGGTVLAQATENGGSAPATEAWIDVMQTDPADRNHLRVETSGGSLRTTHTNDADIWGGDTYTLTSGGGGSYGGYVPYAEPAAGSTSVVHSGLDTDYEYSYSVAAVGDEVNLTGESDFSADTSGCQPSSASADDSPPIGTLPLCGCGR